MGCGSSKEDIGGLNQPKGTGDDNSQGKQRRDSGIVLSGGMIPGTEPLLRDAMTREQYDFFRMLDQKIADGEDYISRDSDCSFVKILDEVQTRRRNTLVNVELPDNLTSPRHLSASSVPEETLKADTSDLITPQTLAQAGAL